VSPIYLHLLVNQLPVAVTVLGVALLAYAVVRGDESRTRTSLALFVFAAVASGRPSSPGSGPRGAWRRRYPPR